MLPSFYVRVIDWLSFFYPVLNIQQFGWTTSVEISILVSCPLIMLNKEIADWVSVIACYVVHSTSLSLHKIIISSSFHFPPDSWHNWSTCFKRKMDWDKWKENYAEWGRSLHTQLCKAFTILSVCSSIANRLLFYLSKKIDCFSGKKKYRLIRKNFVAGSKPIISVLKACTFEPSLYHCAFQVRGVVDL